MNLAILEAIALVAAGNAQRAGHNVSGFWPDAGLFRFAKSCEFLEPRAGDQLREVAPDPNAWLAMMAARGGFRLHTAIRERGPDQTLPVEDRMMAGFVGGGPRWLIETVGTERSQIWEGFQRLLDRNDPQRKIWGEAYILQDETEPQSIAGPTLAQAAHDLRAALTEIEAFAREIKVDNFAQCFADARAALDGAPQDGPLNADFKRYTLMPPPALALLNACEHAWVFGGMGSWNDIGDGGDKPRYDSVSEALYQTLIDALPIVANSTYAS